MILNGPGKISIMVGGQVVGMAKEAKFSIAEDEAPRNFQTLGAHPTSSNRGTYPATQWFGTLATCCVTC